VKFVVENEIECGETTCASEPNKFCRFVFGRKFGTIPVCGIFRDKNGDDVLLKESVPGGRLLRCDQCLAHSKKALP
jgi:hypothetical protein